VCENRVLRRIFGPEKDEVIREWRKLNNEELIWVMKSKRMKWVGHVARKVPIIPARFNEI
jgi:hypothetical protein